MTFARLLAEAIRLLEGARILYMITGSVPSSYHGEPRATLDLDIVIDPVPRSLDRLLDGLVAAGFSVDREAAHEALAARSQFNAIGGDAEKIDFIIRRDRPFSVEEFGRRRRADLLGTPAFVSSAEDAIISKLEWAATTGSDRQLRDVAAMVAIGGDSIDR